MQLKSLEAMPYVFLLDKHLSTVEHCAEFAGNCVGYTLKKIYVNLILAAQLALNKIS